MSNLFLLFEHAAGYGLFQHIESEAIGLETGGAQRSITDYKRFKTMVALKAFRPFSSRENALENINAVSEGALHSDLRDFLLLNLAVGSGDDGADDKKSKKKSKKSKKSTTDFVLGVADDKLGTAIHEQVGVKCNREQHVRDLLRGVRMHFDRFLKGLDKSGLAAAQLGLGHAYSRAKVKYNINRVDNMIIQSIALLDQIDKDLNTFAMRIREWYSWHFPELIRIVSDNVVFARLARVIREKDHLTEEHLPELEEIVQDSGKAQEILAAAASSMGQDISPVDMINLTRFADKVVSLAKFRAEMHAYLVKKMNDIAPNLTALTGEIVGARLIAHAGSLVTLAKYPASTVQILGAEKALFRALKSRSNTPKYGLIFNSSFVGRAGLKNKGRISRYLANKISIAARIDCFQDTPSDAYGTAMREQVEERLRFFETGETPRKNADVMADTIKLVEGPAAKKARSTVPATPTPTTNSVRPLIEELQASPAATASSKKSKDKKDKKDKKSSKDEKKSKKSSRSKRSRD